MLVAGHGNGNAISVPASSTSVEIFDPVTGHWTLAGDLSASRAGATATLLPDGRVLIAGGASTIRQALTAGVLDEIVLDVAPVLLGAGERLLDGATDPGLTPVEVIGSPRATHIRYRVG